MNLACQAIVLERLRQSAIGSPAMFYLDVAAFARAALQAKIWFCPSSHVECFSSLQLALAVGNWHFLRGVLAQLVERLNGIEEVTGSNPVGSKIFQEILESSLVGFEQMPVVRVRQIG